MIHRPIAMFGHVGFICEMPAGSFRDIEIGNSQGVYEVGYYFFTRGLARPWIIQTGEYIPDRSAGWLNYEHPGTSASTGGTLRTDYLEDTEWLCIPRSFNQRKWPTVSSVVLAENQSINLDNGTNLFLVRGQLEVQTKTFVGPCQLRIRSGAVSVLAKSGVYALKFT